jgi:hypothetical protein
MELVPFATDPDNDTPPLFCGKRIRTIPLLPLAPTIAQYASPICQMGDARQWCHMLHLYRLHDDDLEVVEDVNLWNGRHPWDEYIDPWGRHSSATVAVDDGFSLVRPWVPNGHPYHSAGPQIDDLVRSLSHRSDAHEVETIYFGDAGEYNAWPQHVLERLADVIPNVKQVLSGYTSYMQAMYSERHCVSLAAMLYLYPQLQVFAAGGFREEVEALQHNGLQHLLLQVPWDQDRVVSSVLELGLPNLESLELWLGSASRQAPSDQLLAPLLSGKLYPGLRRLGVCNIDEGAVLLDRVLGCPLLGKLEGLTLTHTTLGDENIPDLVRYGGHLRHLDVRCCYFSPEGVQRLTGHFGDRVLASHSRGNHVGWRHCAVVE